MFLESFDKTKIYYRIRRNSDLFLVFVHGWAQNWTAWKKEINFFEKKGYSTLALDLRGHGKSGKPEIKSKYRFECFAKDIRRIIKKENIKHFVLIGHSMGGMISLVYYKLFNKKINALVLCSTTAENILEHKKIKALSPFIKHIVDFIFSHKNLEKEHFSHLKHIDLSKYSEYSLIHNGLLHTPMKSVFACLEAMMKYNVKSILSKIKIPVLIIEGDEDKLIPEICSIEMYEKINNSEMHFIPGAGHIVNIQSPKIVDKHILNFLKEYGLKPLSTK